MAPAAETAVRFLASTVGRDRINRFIQYFARFLVWHAQRSGADKETVSRIANLAAAAGQTRKLMRAGRQLEFLRNAQKAVSTRDDIVRTTTIVKNLGLATWLCFDLLQWIHAAGVAKFDAIKDYNRRGNKAWLVALVASLIGNLHKIRLASLRIDQELKLRKAVESHKIKDDTIENVNASVAQLKSERNGLVYAVVQDSLDILIPSSSLEYIHVESGVVGIAGAITSVMGGYTQLKAVSK